MGGERKGDFWSQMGESPFPSIKKIYFNWQKKNSHAVVLSPFFLMTIKLQRVWGGNSFSVGMGQDFFRLLCTRHFNNFL